MSTGLERIATKAKMNKQCKFTSLTHHLTKELILKHLKKMPKNTASGVDGVSRDEAIHNIDLWYGKAIQQIHNKGYDAPPVKRIYIPKPGKDTKRPIGIPVVADRAIQGAVSEILNQVYEQDFLKYSFGGRPYKSAHKALSTLREFLNSKKVSWVLEADLKNFFGSISHSWIMKFAEERIKDPRVLNLIKRWLKAGIMENGDLKGSFAGVPQGGPVSVLISNIYLHYVLDLWLEYVVKPRMKGEIYWVRYLDDFIICFRYKGDVNKVREVLTRRLDKFGLDLEPAKTRVVEFGRYARLNSERYNRRLETIYFLGFTIYGGISKSGHYVVKFKTEKSRLRRAYATLKETIVKCRHLHIREQCSRINRFLTGHYRYYGLSFNIESLAKIFTFAYKFWKKSLSRRSQNGLLSWNRYFRIYSYYPLAKPKVYLNFKEMTLLAEL